MDSVSTVDSCLGCDRGKMKSGTFKPINHPNRTERRLQLVLSDVCRPLRMKPLGDSVYCLIFVNDVFQTKFIYFLKHMRLIRKCASILLILKGKLEIM